MRAAIVLLLSCLAACDFDFDWPVGPSKGPVCMDLVFGCGGGGGDASITREGMGVSVAFEPAANRWTRRAPMPTARSEAGVGVVNGLVYVLGGMGGGFRFDPLPTVEGFDAAANLWGPSVPLLMSRGSVAAGVVNGVLYVVGGFSSGQFPAIEVYDPAQDFGQHSSRQ